MYDVTVVGAGLAGLQIARLLAKAGVSVLLVDARRSITASVRTTGIFVRKTFEDFPSLDGFLGPAIRTIALHSPAGRSMSLTSPRDEFRVGRMRPLFEALLLQAIAAGAEWRPATTYAGLDLRGDSVEVTFRGGGSVRTRFLVGADGARSLVARHLGLDGNREWLTGVERLYRSASPAAPRFDCWIDPSLAPGYLAWAVDDGEEMHVGVGGRPRRFDPVAALGRFEERLLREERIAAASPCEVRGGLIPAGGILRRIAACWPAMRPAPSLRSPQEASTPACGYRHTPRRFCCGLVKPAGRSKTTMEPHTGPALRPGSRCGRCSTSPAASSL